jgi:biopolymer transport protein ExbD
MTPLRLLFFLGIAFIIFLFGLCWGIWWYLFGSPAITAAELVPANTLVLATIPNAATIIDGYETSQVKTVVESPNAQPLHDVIVNTLGQKNFDLLNAFLPNLSGQSFIAITHYDGDHPEQIGLIAAMKPKAGLGDFGTFLEKLKATWPDILKQGKTGTGTVEGVEYEWLQGPGAPDKICVAQIKGWIVTSWGEASLQDWIQRFRKQSTTSSLADDADYRASLARVGDDPMTLAYVNCHALAKIIQPQLALANPALGDYLARKFDAIGGAAVATRFENGEIVDRFSFLFPRPAQLDAGMSADPCPFDTLKFTGPDTRFYWASSINWEQYYKNLKAQADSSSTPTTTVNPMTKDLFTFLGNWVRSESLDAQHSIVDALGPELSVQAEWSQDETWPTVGLLVKIDKPDDFKPTIAAIIDSVRKAYATSAVIDELDSNGQKFATLKFIPSGLFSPTITEDGPYLGVFLTENQAVRSFQRDPSIILTHNDNFNRQIGDKRNGAAQILFLDSPYLLDRSYKTAMPYLSIASMFNKDLATMLKGGNLPPDLGWLAPIGTWSCVITPDDTGIEGYSVSGIGNQGIFLSGALDASAPLLQSLGFLPKSNLLPSAQMSLALPMLPGYPSGASLSPRNIKIAPFPSTPKLPALNNNNPDEEARNQGPGAVIYIKSDDKIFFDNIPIPSDQLGDYLKARKAANQDLRLIVHVDKNASPSDLALVMDAGSNAGFGVLSYFYTSGEDSIPPGAVLYLTSDGQIFFNDNDNHVPLDQIGDFLKAEKDANPNLKLIVHVDRDAPQSDLTKVIDAGSSADFGVLPYLYESGADSLPPIMKPGEVAALPPPDTTTNVAPTNTPPLATPPLSDGTTNATPSAPATNTNSDATPPNPPPAKTQ